jgi:hypothetical protein
MAASASLLDDRLDASDHRRARRLRRVRCASSALLLARGLSMYSAVGNIVRLVFLVGGLYVAFTWFALPQAILVLAMSPLAIYLPAVMVGFWRHFRSVMKVEVLSFLAFMATVGATVLGWWVLAGR